MFRRGARKDGSSYIPRIRLNRANVRRRETFLSNLTFILSPSNLGRSHFPTLSFYILDLAVRARSMRVTHKSLLGQRWVDSSAFRALLHDSCQSAWKPCQRRTLPRTWRSRCSIIPGVPSLADPIASAMVGFGRIPNRASMPFFRNPYCTLCVPRTSPCQSYPEAAIIRHVLESKLGRSQRRRRLNCQ